MRLVLVLFSVSAATAAGYLLGAEGGDSVGAYVAGAAAVLAVVFAFLMPQATRRETDPTRFGQVPVPARPKLSAPRSAESVWTQEEESILAAGGPVSLRLIDTGKNQIALIKVLRTFLDVGLKEAKDISDGARQGGRPLIAQEIDSDQARAFASAIAAAGGLAEVEEVATR